MVCSFWKPVTWATFLLQENMWPQLLTLYHFVLKSQHILPCGMLLGREWSYDSGEVTEQLQKGSFGHPKDQGSCILYFFVCIRLVTSHTCPAQGSNPQPRYVPWFSIMGQHSNPLATTEHTRKKNYFQIWFWIWTVQKTEKINHKLGIKL